MKTLFMLWQLECLKLKRTLALALTFIAPATVVVLNFLVFSQQGERIVGDGVDPWIFFFQQVMVLWSLLMMPLFVTLETALLAGLEHQEGHWGQILAQPVPRWMIYAAKGIAAWTLFAVSLLSLFLLTLGATSLLSILKPAIPFGDFPVPWIRVLYFLGLSFLSAGLVISIHQWIALRSRGFVLPLGVGMVMTVAGMLIMNSEWRVYYPWAMPGIVANGFMMGSVSWSSVAVGAIGGLLLGALAVLDLSRRDVT
jgi:lantibiotic transport system permease protein